MIDLNSKEFNANAPIINGGKAGKVKVIITDVTKRSIDESESHPDYNVIFTDENGGTLKAGFYYPKNKEDKTEEANTKLANLNVGRILAIAKTVVPTNYEFPTVNSAKEAYDKLFNIIRENGINKHVYIFLNYGTSDYPQEYLRLRFFDFIESVDASFSRLIPKKDDLLERIIADADDDEGMMINTNKIDDFNEGTDESTETWDT